MLVIWSYILVGGYMLKRMSIRKIMVASLSLVALFLVYLMPSNSSSDYIIEKLVQRNELLLELIKDDKYKNELQNAIEQDYVHKFYIACKL